MRDHSGATRPEPAGIRGVTRMLALPSANTKGYTTSTASARSHGAHALTASVCSRRAHRRSLLRPPALLRRRATSFATGAIDRQRLTAAENEAIRNVVKLQEEVGLQVVTDGEFRRGTYSDSFTISGISGVSVELTEDTGLDAARHHTATAWRGAFPRWSTASHWNGPQNAADFRFLKSLTERTPKITLPGPCYIHYRAGRANISRDAYPDLDAFWSDLTAAYAQEMRSLAEVGCTYLQIDETSLVKLGDPRVQALLEERGDDWRDLLRDLYRRSQRGRRRRAGRHDGRRPHLPQPGPELAGRRRL